MSSVQSSVPVFVVLVVGLGWVVGVEENQVFSVGAGFLGFGVTL